MGPGAPLLFVLETSTHSPLLVWVLEKIHTPNWVNTATMTVETRGWTPPQEGNLIDIVDMVMSQAPPPHQVPAASVDLVQREPDCYIVRKARYERRRLLILKNCKIKKILNRTHLTQSRMACAFSLTHSLYPNIYP